MGGEPVVAYIVNRLLQMVVVIFGISVIVFVITNMLGDPVGVSVAAGNAIRAT